MPTTMRVRGLCRGVVTLALAGGLLAERLVAWFEAGSLLLLLSLLLSLRARRQHQVEVHRLVVAGGVQQRLLRSQPLL